MSGAVVTKLHELIDDGLKAGNWGEYVNWRSRRRNSFGTHSERGRRVARVFEFPDTTTKWVPRPSRILRRAGTGLPAAWDFTPEAHATRFRNEMSPHPTFTCTRPGSFSR